MATLQKIRSKGPLLLIVVGLALFAFIAGDAWKVLAPHQSQNIGEINGKKVSAQDYQALVEEYTDAVKFSQGVSALNEEQTEMIKDEAWNSYVNNQLIENEAHKLGLVVSDAELEDIINEGTNPLLANTPFRNQQTGLFDKDMLNMFLANYAQMRNSQSSELSTYYQSLYKYWKFIEKTLKQSRLAAKYQTLVAKSLLSNPVEVENLFNARANQYDLLIAAVPYTSVQDSTVPILKSELQKAYDKKKEQFKQYVETRNISYIDVQVTASDSDRAVIQREMNDYTQQLKENVSNYATLVRSAASEQPYTDLFYTKSAYPADVIARLDSVPVGGVFGPYYNVSDNTLNSFKKLAVESLPDSVEYREIQVMSTSLDKTRILADSIYNAIKGGASFTDLAKKYGQTGEAHWIASANYEGAQLDGDNLTYIAAITTLAPKQLTNVELGQANIIVEVTNRKANVEKYKVAVVKRRVDFSKETYNKAYNDFSQFIAANNTLEKLRANAEDAGYKLYAKNELSSSEHNVGGIRGTKEALRWVFGAKPGEVSGLYECGESDRMIVVGLENINKVGYRPITEVRNELVSEIRRDKKAEKLLGELKDVTSFDGVKNMANAVSDTIKHVTFGAPAYVTCLQGSEPEVSAYASISDEGKVSAPIKGRNGVYVLETIAKSKLDEEQDSKSIEEDRTMMLMNIVARQLSQDLYLKANVKDKRYLFF